MKKPSAAKKKEQALKKGSEDQPKDKQKKEKKEKKEKKGKKGQARHRGRCQCKGPLDQALGNQGKEPGQNLHHWFERRLGKEKADIVPSA